MLSYLAAFLFCLHTGAGFEFDYDFGLDMVEFDWKYSSKTGLFEMELTAITFEEHGAYVAVAFAKDALMERAEGYYCNGYELRSIVIQMHQEPPMELVLEDDPKIQLVSVANDTGFLTCTFTRAPSIRREVSFGEYYDFDFSNESYHVLTATGPTTDGRMGYHTYRAVTEAPTSFSAAMLSPEDECGIEQKCYTYPHECNQQTPECLLFCWEKDDGYYTFELRGGTGNGEQYVAVAFSTDEKMENADLYYCTGEELRSAVIREKHQAPVDLNATIGIIDHEVATVQGIGQCIFKRSPCLYKEISSGINQRFDFFAEEYYILLAFGDMKDGKPVYHGENRVHSKVTVHFTDGCEDSNYTCPIVTGDSAKHGPALLYMILITGFSLLYNYIITI